MANTVKLGSVNFPKLMRQVGYRTNQVRDLVFARDAIFQKTVGNKKDDDGSPGDGTGRSTAMARPDVSFGYEGRLSTALPGTAANTAYHVNSPELILPGLKAVQTPIISRSGNLERTGHRITGACTFYMPSMGYIKALDNFSETDQFDEIETFDKLIDMERIIHKFDDATGSGTRKNFTFPSEMAGYEIDRFQFKIKSALALEYIETVGLKGSAVADMRWTESGSETLTLSSSEWTTIDIPIRDIAVNDTTLVYKDGVGYTFTASTDTGIMNIDTFIGDSGSDRIDGIEVNFVGGGAFEVKDIYAYKQAEWRVESIKDYRDEYMEVAAVRVRGDRTSRRRAYG